MSEIKISMLLPIRPNSKLIAHFLMGYLMNTSDFENTELLLMPSKKDEWNKDLYNYVDGKKGIKIYWEPEDIGEGQRGHHLFLNELATHATGEWLLSSCDDFGIIKKDWDKVIRDFIKAKGLDPEKVHQIIPGFAPSGSLAIMISRGWYRISKQMSGYPNGDSWVNTVMDILGEDIKPTRRHDITTPLFVDYSRDVRVQVLTTNDYPASGAKKMRDMPEEDLWGGKKVQIEVREEAERIRKGILENGK